ncbi:siderophore biosynthesis [Fusarium sporotrichioides]|uniref:Siderophore biosynthesis n=1 Tax=Fusarium sporotrichioides TaxID=5514 RepID=A0A395RF66_FUSSP|nr:siderophore biosynthesis [Fusarium sporotrichioides]
MVKTTLLSALPVLMLAEQALGFGCSTHSFTTCEDKIVHWFDPDDGMICDPLDCGGGRAPVKTGVPGCANYSGTETRGTSYLSCWKPSTTLATASAEATSEVVSADPEPTSTAIETETESTTETHAVEPSTSGVVEATVSEITTVAPVIPSQTQTTVETQATEPASTPSVSPNAAQTLKGSLIAVAAVAIGAMLL